MLEESIESQELIALLDSIEDLLLKSNPIEEAFNPCAYTIAPKIFNELKRSHEKYISIADESVEEPQINIILLLEAVVQLIITACPISAKNKAKEYEFSGDLYRKIYHYYSEYCDPTDGDSQ